MMIISVERAQYCFDGSLVLEDRFITLNNSSTKIHKMCEYEKDYPIRCIFANLVRTVYL